MFKSFIQFFHKYEKQFQSVALVCIIAATALFLWMGERHLSTRLYDKKLTTYVEKQGYIDNLKVNKISSITLRCVNENSLLYIIKTNWLEYKKITESEKPISGCSNVKAHVVQAIVSGNKVNILAYHLLDEAQIDIFFSNVFKIIDESVKTRLPAI